jgi:hypothetical protein
MIAGEDVTLEAVAILRFQPPPAGDPPLPCATFRR